MFSHTQLLQRFETAMVLQGFAPQLAKALEVSMERVFVQDKIVVELAQQCLFGLGYGRPVDQGQLFKTLQFISQAGGVNGPVECLVPQDAGGSGVQAVEKQTAGR